MRLPRPSWKSWAAACSTAVAAGVLALALRGRLEPPSPAPSRGIQLRDVTEATGITFIHTDGSEGERYIVETVTAGLALLDYNGDGYIDVYFLNGAPLAGAEVDVIPTNALYRNEGGWRFTDVTEAAGVGDTGFGLGVAAGDYDNDGDPDLIVNNYGPNVLYRNNGDGTFSDVTALAGIDGGHDVGAGACFLDVDGDGNLDLYMVNYIDFTYENHVSRKEEGLPVYAGPRDYRPRGDYLYRNDGDGTFSDISDESGIGLYEGTGMGIVAADFDNDGDTDLFVLNDVAENFLFINDGRGKFEEVGLPAGVAYNGYGDELGSMGVDCADYDNDGWLDLFMTSYEGEMPVLYRNLGNGSFEDVTQATGAGAGAFPYVTWGAGLIDFDNDGDRDLFIACGHLQDNVDPNSGITAYQVRNILLENTGDGKFRNVSDLCGDGLSAVLSSRGAAFDDLDNDGDVDAVVLNSRREPTIIKNDSANDHHWIQIRLRGTRTNRDGVGSRVKVVAGDLVQVDEVHSGRGYQSHFGSRLHFGLGGRDRIDRIEVHWLGGDPQVLNDVAVDQLLRITQEEVPPNNERKRRGP